MGIVGCVLVWKIFMKKYNWHWDCDHLFLMSEQIVGKKWFNLQQMWLWLVPNLLNLSVFPLVCWRRKQTPSRSRISLLGSFKETTVVDQRDINFIVKAECLHRRLLFHFFSLFSYSKRHWCCSYSTFWSVLKRDEVIRHYSTSWSLCNPFKVIFYLAMLETKVVYVKFKSLD